MNYLSPIPSDLAPAFDDASVTAPLNAAQHLALEGFATRYRCTVGELTVALALGRLEELGAGDYNARDGAILADLLEYADAGRSPRNGDSGLPFELVEGGCPKQRERQMRHTHGHAAALVRYARGDISPGELERLTSPTT